MTTYAKVPGPAGAKGEVGAVGAGFRRTYSLSDGATSSAWSTPDHASLDVTGLIDLIFAGIPNSFFPAAQQDLIGKANSSGANRSYRLSIKPTTGNLRFTYSPDGTTSLTIDSDLLPTELTTSKGLVFLRCLADPTAGTSGNAAAAFYYSFDGVSWTKIGATNSGSAPGPWSAGTAILYAGRSAVGAGSPYTGRIYRAQVWNGDSTAGGTLVADLDVESLDSATFNPGTTTYTDQTGKVWTSGSTSAAKVSENTNLDFLDKSIAPGRVIGLDPSLLAVLAWIRPRPVDLRDPQYAVAATNVDNAIAINAALANQDGRGGSVYLPETVGKYLNNHPVIMRANVGFFGDQGYDQGGTDVCVIKRGTLFPETVTTSSVTTPADAITGFTLPVSATTNFPMCSGGIALTYGIGVLRIGGITVYYRGFDGTNFLNCTSNYPGVVIPLGATVTCDLIWDGEPGYPAQTPGTLIKELSVDVASKTSRHWWTCHAAEGSGPRRCRFFNGVTGHMTFEYPPRTIGGGGAIAGPPHNWQLPGDMSLGWSATAATADAIGVDVYATPFTGAGAYGRGAFKALDGLTIGGDGGGSAKAGIRVNGMDGVIRGAHLERAGIIVGDLQPTVLTVDHVHFGQCPDIDYGVHLGPYCKGANIGMMIASRAGATLDPTAAPTDGAAMRLIYDEVTGKKSSALVAISAGYKRDTVGTVTTDLAMT